MFFRERLSILALVRDTLALLTAATKPNDEPDEECPW
jgi:hypothetical protein